MESTKSTRRIQTAASKARERVGYDSLGREKKQKRKIRPAEIFDLRLNTSKVNQQNRVLKTQLTRIQDRINIKTKAINRTVANSRDPTEKNHGNTIKQIRESITAAENTIRDLNNQLEEARDDDRLSIVDELKEELKIAYCEYQRLIDAVKENKLGTGDLKKRLQDADRRAGKAHTKDLERMIAAVKENNNVLKEKLEAYQKKMERNKIEAIINKRRADGKSQELCMLEIEDTKRYRTEKYNMLADELNAEIDNYDSKVDRLNSIIEEMRNKIIDRLLGSHDDHNEEEVN